MLIFLCDVKRVGAECNHEGRDLVMVFNKNYIENMMTMVLNVNQIENMMTMVLNVN